MKAMILAAGRGERMRPLTDNTPKPLLEVGGIALIVWHIERLVHHGFYEIVVNLGHLGEQIRAVLGDGSQWGAAICYSDEQAEGALESAGGIVKALPLLADAPFLVVNADIWTDYIFDRAYLLQADTLAHLILVPSPDYHPKGDFGLADGIVTDRPALTFAGIGYYSPEFFRDIPYGKQPLGPWLRRAIRRGHVSGQLHTGEWRDIGTPERLEEINRHLMSDY
jgi:N-acetyl-alpha-D-muramate 1-phosphate uridylyltransferase